MNKLITLLISILLITSCAENIVIKNTPHNVFNSFWQIMSDQYVFFEERNLNWDSIYQVYNSKITNQTSDTTLQTYIQEIITHIKDQHVSVLIPNNKLLCFNDSSYFQYIGSYETNQLYRITNINMNNVIVLGQMQDSILYFRIRTFSFNNENEVLSWIKSTVKEYNYNNGIILDIRNNGGGNEYLSFSGLFYNGSRELYKVKYRVNKDRKQFTDLFTKEYKGNGLFPENIPIALIINKNTYSMGNLFAFIMKDLPNCITIGQKTGGGGGTGFNYMLPNNWVLQVTTSKVYSPSGELMENGLSPDIEKVPTKEFWEKTYSITGEDPQLEDALKYLKNRK